MQPTVITFEAGFDRKTFQASRYPRRKLSIEMTQPSNFPLLKRRKSWDRVRLENAMHSMFFLDIILIDVQTVCIPRANKIAGNHVPIHVRGHLSSSKIEQDALKASIV